MLKHDISITPQEVYASSATQGTDLGALATTGDGRYFRYALGTGTAMVAGKLYQNTPLDATNWQNLTVSSSSAAGLYTVTCGSSVSIVANLMSGGILTIIAGGGAGFSYKIKSHPVAAATGITFTLEEPLQVATVAGTTVFNVTPNLYSNVVINSAIPMTGVPVGVAVANTPANQYCWLQVKGLAGVYSDAVNAGAAMAPSLGTTGAIGVGQIAVGSLCIVGYAVAVTTANKYNPVLLTLP